MALEDYLNSRPLVDFDDETKQIRAETDKLRRRIHTSIPHPRKSAPLQILPYYSNSYEKINMYSDRPHHPMVDDILYMSYYSEPSAKTIGRGHLACVTFAGGRGYPRRRNHYFSDENRDIGEEIKTRSYYNNSFSKSYVDAMSLPTGYASYLLRLKPPESNGTLTNLDKMHIIALAEERKRNIKRNKTDGDSIDPEQKPKALNEISGPKGKELLSKLERQLSKPEQESIYKRSLKETKKELTEDKSSDYVSSIIKQNSDSRPESNVVLSKEEVSEEVPEKEEPEPPKPEKKGKQKKSSLSRNASVQETPKEKVEEESPQKQVAEQTVRENVKDALITSSQPESLPAATEEIKSSSETEQRTAESVEEVKSSENLPPVEREIEVLPSEQPQQQIVSESSTNDEQTLEEPCSTEQSVPEEKRDEADVSIETVCEEVPIEDVREGLLSAESNQKEEELLPSEPHYEEEEEDGVQNIPNAPENIENVELTETVTEVNKDEVNNELLKENEQIQFTENEEKDNARPEEEVKTPSEHNVEVPISLVDAEKEGEVAVTESSDTKTEIREEGFEVTSTVITSTEVRSTVITSRTEVTVSENVVEDESRTSEIDTLTKENQPEPLIEEPQSPCDADIITSKLNSNDICEVLSDVPEES